MAVKISSGAQGKKYKLPQTIVRDEDRSVTDGKYRILFGVILAIWITSCIYALSYSASEESSLQNEIIAENVTHHNSNDENETTTASVGWIKRLFISCEDKTYGFDTNPITQNRVSSVIFWVGIIFYTALILLTITMMHIWTAISPPALIAMSSITIIISIIYHIVQYFINDTNKLELLNKKMFYWLGPEAVLLILSIITFFNVMLYKGVSEMHNLLKAAFRFYIKCRYLLIVSFLITAMILVLTIFTSKVLKTISFNSIESKIMYSIIYCGSCYMIILIHAFGKMVISAAAASYYWNENDQQSFFKVMCQKIIVISKYQFGSACCKAIFTSLWFIPLLFIIYGYEFQCFDTAVGYCLIFECLQILAFDNTVFLIGMYGLSASEASYLFFSLFKQISRLIAVTFQGLWSATFIILLPTNCLLLILMWGLNKNNEESSFESNGIYIDTIVVSLPITFVLGTIEDARLICVMKDKEEKEELEEKKLKQLKIITHSNVNSEKNEEFTE